MKGIPFKTWEVQALAAGRLRAIVRVCKNQPYSNGFMSTHRDEILCHNDYLPPSAMLMDVGSGRRFRYTTSDHEGWESECPIGQPGERFFVRETYAWSCAHKYDDTICIAYRAAQPLGCTGFVVKNIPNTGRIGAVSPIDDVWRSPITMPEWAARFRPMIESVRVCRVQDLTDDDAFACGHDYQQMTPTGNDNGSALHGPYGFIETFSADNGNTYDANPWVWFVRIGGNHEG